MVARVASTSEQIDVCRSHQRATTRDAVWGIGMPASATSPGPMTQSGGTAGDHKGPPRIHPTTLAPTESWMCALG